MSTLRKIWADFYPIIIWVVVALAAAPFGG